MTVQTSGRIAILWRGDREARLHATARYSRFHLIFEELAKLGITAEPAVYDEDTHEEVRAQLQQVDGVLVWVNPLQDGRTRLRLNQLLREVATARCWVSAHPDVIAKMGVKDVLFRTRGMSWSAGVELYESFSDFQTRFPKQLALGRPRVLKQSRGNDGQGVWKVERVASASGTGEVRVREAHAGSEPTTMALARFFASCRRYFDDGGAVVDQPFQPRLRDGMIRCYVSEDRVVGFGHQHPQGLMDPAAMHPDAALGKVMFPADAQRFGRLRQTMEVDWIPQLMACLDVAKGDMPVIWDADFLYGPVDEAGADTYVLCEINVSSVFAIPDQAASAIAECVLERFEQRVSESRVAAACSIRGVRSPAMLAP
ncbi:MAG TPA: Cj0069 family protein [Bosea sp. (in: a-proteobacteria)]|jgi:hypothetical protein|uniref:Cj0069 family protein n=1 Tax=Bosea sp. (in: a-proteobacteria) TaxID=1871050 RepID=UPI002E10B852|nr:Cj0069 family protein [Bosea sp. (in: a-proteobacteria)]